MKKQKKFQNTVNKHPHDIFIVNLSSNNLTTQQSRVLEIGLSFFQSNKPSIPKLFAPIKASFKYSKMPAAQ